MLASAAFVVLGLLGWVIAMNKGRSVLGWLVLGLVFGPFTLIAPLIVPRKRL